MTHFIKTQFKFLLMALFAGMILAIPAQAQQSEDEVVNLDELLDKVRAGIQTQSQEFQRREAEFRAARDRQAQLLRDARAERAREEQRSNRLEAQYNSNEQRITTLTGQLREKLGNLNEVFGVLQGVAGDTRSHFQTSYVSAEFPGREEALTALIQKSAEGTDLPTIEEIEGLWAAIQGEMTESGKISTFTTEISRPDGSTATVELTRVGDFNIVGDGGKYFVLDETGKLKELGRQPSGRYTGTVDDLIEASNGEVVAFGIDPTRGSILDAFVDMPSWLERIPQGGYIGYVTLFLGFIGVLLALLSGVNLVTTKGKVSRQMKDVGNPQGNNPLGRVLQAYHENKDVDVETLELKLDEAILKETPALERFLTLIKLISAVAPLLGLLGTVTGMIITFQAITLFGTGDPKMMAGGISQALVTTVLGLVVAIPTLLLHSIVSGMSKGVVHTLEEQSSGLIAQHAEKEA